ncbi:chaperonin-like RbcX protein 2, chloroplastic [Solanum stenotomum]|uniref:chaperonin-like RbcX protein 2, chloroplastic n=1 Tax=Solanum stenotomum TaxID=172797 RepID=UPI0020D0ABD6|nr:chaperonin-like RbcX protein 2, chloroplastic [Solanum stenotomum]
MVGALSVVGSPMVDSHSSPCLCLDALPTCNLGIGDSLARKQKQLPRLGAMELSTSFVDLRFSAKCVEGNYKNLKKQTKGRKNLRIVNDLGGQYEENFSDIKTQILNYFTYKAVRTILNQLNEMNPPQYHWFNDYVTANKPRDGKHFIRNLAKEKQELAEKVMATRLSLYAKWIKKCDHKEIYNQISDQNVEVMRERLMETVIWPSDDTSTGMK